MFTQIIKSNYPDYGWIAILVQVLMIISVAVSFLTMGAGMRHMGKKAYRKSSMKPSVGAYFFF